MDQIVTKLLNWFALNQREMPWRHENRDPYHVWLSEIMLQQTQVKTVIPYFNRFIAVFPTVQALASAPLDQVLKLWEGLGYYSRARNLHKGANYVVSEHSGVVPHDLKAILAVPGIGPYTAGAILSLAYNKPHPAIDGNVIRVISRWFNIGDDMREKKNWPQIERQVVNLMPKGPKGRVGQFNEALMEFGALHCKPQQPQCANCPLTQDCDAFRDNVVDQRPFLAPKPKPKELEKVAIVYRQKSGLFQIVQEAENLLKGLWRLPWSEITPENSRYLGKVTHRFTHLIWRISVYEVQIDVKSDMKKGVWIQKDQYDQYPFSKVALKMLKLIKR